MKWTSHHALLTTLLYAQLFEYPMRASEVWLWYVDSTVLSQSKVQRLLSTVPEYKKFYCLEQVKKHVSIREEKFIFSQKKIEKLPRIVTLLAKVPSIELIGMSGGVAMNNADEKDDIDLFFIVRPHTIWISRLLILGILEVLGKRRVFNNPFEKDLICANMFVSSAYLQIPEKEQDLYAAHEVLQMIPLFERNGMYQHFLGTNIWVKKYLANAWLEKSGRKQDPLRKEQEKSLSSIVKKSAYSIFLIVCYLLEIPAKLLQYWYMQPHQTTEIISDHILRFHPMDTRQFIKQRYFKLLKKYKVPLDSPIFKSLQ